MRDLARRVEALEALRAKRDAAPVQVLVELHPEARHAYAEETGDTHNHVFESKADAAASGLRVAFFWGPPRERMVAHA
jgi:dienelactone hydrolase